jgi:hypothetical protein
MIPGEIESEIPATTIGDNVPRYSRRLSDEVLIAFHIACDQHDFDAAETLLRIVEAMHERPQPYDRRRRGVASLVAAHERLWLLRHETPPLEDLAR